MKLKLTLLAFVATLFSNITYAETPLYTEYPHTIVCAGVSRGHNYEMLFYLTHVSHTEFVRYDSGNSNEMLHFYGGTGAMAVQHSTPTWTDCVTKQMSIADLIKAGKALNMFSTIPSGNKFTN